jgi:hypothetical protein
VITIRYGVTVTVAHTAPARAVADCTVQVCGVVHHHVHTFTHVYGTPLSALSTTGDRCTTGLGTFTSDNARNAS